MFGLTVFASLLLAVSQVQAHATFQDLWINGVDQANKCVRPPASNNPITSVSTNDITCNVNGGVPAAGNCAAKAGDTLAVEMHQQPGDRSCANEAIGGDHWGPTIIYMAKVDNLATTTPWSASWFKVNATGLINANSNPQFWASEDMNNNCGKVYFKVPSDIAAGNYLVRAEVIALHVASSVGGAQFYASCYQLTVTGGGSANPSGVKFPGAYSATDPGILINIHYPLPTSYTIPGPAVYTGGGGSGSSPSQSQSNTQTTTTTTTRTSTTTASSSATSSTSSSSGATAAQYAQCGGQGYSGPTTCASPYKCVAVSPPYYSQCQ